MKYRGWTIADAWCGFVATHDANHDESGRWQVNAQTVEEVKELIDEREDEG